MLAAPPTKCGVPKQRSSHSVDVKSAGLREQLLRILKGKSVHRGTFTLASGAQSDLYIDAKETTSDPEGLILVDRVGWQLVKDTAARLQVRLDSIGVLPTGAQSISSTIRAFSPVADPSTPLDTPFLS